MSTSTAWANAYSPATNKTHDAGTGVYSVHVAINMANWSTDQTYADLPDCVRLQALGRILENEPPLFTTTDADATLPADKGPVFWHVWRKAIQEATTECRDYPECGTTDSELADDCACNPW